MTKRKPRPIPNAEEVARSLKDAAKPWYDMAKGFGVPERDAEIMERGRTIGRLEMLADWMGSPPPPGMLASLQVGRADALLIAPILRAEIERLRSAKP